MQQREPRSTHEPDAAVLPHVCMDMCVVHDEHGMSHECLKMHVC